MPRGELKKVANRCVCGRRLYWNNRKGGICTPCWRATPDGIAAAKSYNRKHYEGRRRPELNEMQAKHCGCGKILLVVNMSGYCDRCWPRSPEAKRKVVEAAYKRRHALRVGVTPIPCACGCREGLRYDIAQRKLRNIRSNAHHRAVASTPQGKVHQLLQEAGRRAAKKGLPSGITVSDLSPLPMVCPVLGVPLAYTSRRSFASPDSASLDRIVPSLGYVRGNVRIISWRANHLRSDGSAAELMAVAIDAARLAASTTLVGAG